MLKVKWIKAGFSYLLKKISNAKKVNIFILPTLENLNNSKKTKCELLLLNNSFASKYLYRTLRGHSDSKEKGQLPLNAHQVGDTWKCDTGYKKERGPDGNKCIKINENFLLLV